MSSGLISRSSSKKRWEQSHIDKGLCIKCSLKSEEGRIMCRKHLNYLKMKREARQKDL